MTEQPASTLRQDNMVHADTSDDNLVPVTTDAQITFEDPDEFLARQVGILTTFLLENFPDEVGRTNRQQPETAVETAIRLLSGLHAHSGHPDALRVRCSEPYCNRPKDHVEDHGWLHYG